MIGTIVMMRSASGTSDGHARRDQQQQENGDVERDGAGTGGDAGDIETKSWNRHETNERVAAP